MEKERGSERGWLGRRRESKRQNKQQKAQRLAAQRQQQAAAAERATRGWDSGHGAREPRGATAKLNFCSRDWHATSGHSRDWHATSGQLRARVTRLSLTVRGSAGRTSARQTSRPELGRAAAELIAGARFEVIEGQAHQPFQEVPDDWNARVDAFWSEVGERSS